ncbi:MAG TPA: phosphoglycolate phosphatase [Burkholderiales bacterium]|nr:phosphoglycolate phosphatase [Burkholderiales bacterium]
MTARFRAVLCDLDGTLLDTAQDLANAANRMLADMKLPLRTASEISRYIGKGIPTLVHRSLSGRLDGKADAALYERALPLFENYYAEESGLNTRLYPGVLEGLAHLRAAGIPLACLTNKAERYTLDLLKDMDLASYFDLIVSGDSLPRKKPDPMPVLHACERLGATPDQALMVGDSMNDVEAARAAGVRVIVVPYGYTEGEPVESLCADAVVADLRAAAAYAGA